MEITLDNKLSVGNTAAGFMDVAPGERSYVGLRFRVFDSMSYADAAAQAASGAIARAVSCPAPAERPFGLVVALGSQCDCEMFVH